MVEAYKNKIMAQGNLKSTEICYPEQETWFICWDDERNEIKAYGHISTDQCLDTYWDEVDLYLSEAEWLEVLIENGIEPFYEIESEA